MTEEQAVEVLVQLENIGSALDLLTDRLGHFVDWINASGVVLLGAAIVVVVYGTYRMARSVWGA